MKRCWSRNAPKLIKTIKTQNSGELQTKVDPKKEKNKLNKKPSYSIVKLLKTKTKRKFQKQPEKKYILPSKEQQG